MSLNWDISKVADNEDLKEGDEWAITETLIWMTMTVGLRGITEKNVDEFIFRAALAQAVVGPWLSHGIYVTDEMIRRRIGLSTNVSDETRSAWLKRMLEIHPKEMIARQRRTSNEIMAKLEAEAKVNA